MERFYQTEWQEISFEEFKKLNSRIIADSKFYNAFYNAFFKKYSDFDQLDKNWLEQKNQIATFIYEKYLKGETNNSSYRALSVGSGLGIVEKYIYEKGFENLFLQENQNTSFYWIKKDIPDEKLLIGNFGEIKIEGAFDFIFLVAVDYCFDNRSLVDFIKSLKRILKDGGDILFVSASYYENSFGRRIKYLIKDVLLFMCTKKDRQFWGYLRTRKEYNKILQKAEFKNIEDGYINQKHYYIKGNI